MSNFPFVSIIIPCRNEEMFISKCLDSIIANNYPPDKLEVLIMDGMSQDGSREIVKTYALKNPFIKLLDNPQKVTPCALNIGIKNAKGEIIMRMDAHATYEKEYISKCVRCLDTYKADNVGGTMITLPRNDNTMGKAIVLALSNRFGVGNSTFRTGINKISEVDTLFGGCYRREIFDKIGLFNERLVSSQDIEFNLRLKKAGGKILLVPDIVSHYYTRSNFLTFCKNNFRNGLWVIIPFKYTNIIPVSLRHLIPLAFILSLIGTLSFSFISNLFKNTLLFQIFFIAFLFIAIFYLLTNLVFSVQITIREKKLTYALLMPIIFTSLHIGYGLGSLWGAIKLLLSKQFWKNLKKILGNQYGQKNI